MRWSALVVIAASALFLCSCATAPRTYAPPSPAKLNASTERVRKAVDAAHASARQAQGKVNEARARQKEIAAEIKKLKDVPVSLIEKVNAQDAALEEASQRQTELEAHFVEADKAKADVEKDKADYFSAAQGLADTATNERNARIKAEKSLSWYRWHWYLGFIVLGAGVILCVVIAILKFTGRLALKTGFL